jgi:perosamine synthetase
MSVLAIKGGEPITKEPFPSQADLYKDGLIEGIKQCFENKLLTGYQANVSNFYGGPFIQELEEKFMEMFGTGHAIACNSCTSALHIACMAIGLRPGDEVIVSPYTMTCSATAPMLCGAKPVFVDIEPDFYCLDPEKVEDAITEKTKAIIVVDIFGQPHDVVRIKDIAERHNLRIIEDAAQAIGSKFRDGYAGTFGDIGCFSFNQGKHISSGEGGMIATDDEELAFKCRLLMNHAESVVNDAGCSNLPEAFPIKEMIEKYPEVTKMWGFNMRMTELIAAITVGHLEAFPIIMKQRLTNVRLLNGALEEIPPIIPSQIRPNCTHTHYVQSFLWDKSFSDGIDRDDFINAVKVELTPIAGREREGVPISCGYIKPLYDFPIFQDEANFLPVVERLWTDDLFLMRFCAPPNNPNTCNLVIDAFFKVWENRKDLL